MVDKWLIGTDQAYVQIIINSIDLTAAKKDHAGSYVITLHHTTKIPNVGSAVYILSLGKSIYSHK